MLVDLARKVPGVNIVDALTRVTASAIKVLKDTPDVQKTVAELAEIGAVRDVEDVSRFQFNKKVIGLVDKAGRLVRNQMFDNLAERSLIKDSEPARREWVNQMGNYNGRLMGQFQRFFKEAGFSPFVVAGRNFNRMAARRIMLDPGVKAASPAAAAQMRAVEAFGLLATVWGVSSLVNYFTVGNPNGRPGVKQGQIDTGSTSKDGNAIVIDPAQWTGVRRGLRISGIQAVMEGLKAGQGPRKITHQMIQDILGGIIHPWAGPAVSAPVIAATGHTPTFYKESEDPYDYGKNAMAALRQLNPMAAAAIKAQGQHGGVSGMIGRVGTTLSSAAGIKTVHVGTAAQQIMTHAKTWMEQSSSPDVRRRWEQGQQYDAVSEYGKLRSAVNRGDEKGARQVLASLRATDKPQAKRDAEIVKAMRQHATRPFTGSKAHEEVFKKSLSASDRRLYDAARMEQQQELEKFLKVWKKRS